MSSPTVSVLKAVINDKMYHSTWLRMTLLRGGEASGFHFRSAKPSHIGAPTHGKTLVLRWSSSDTDTIQVRGQELTEVQFGEAYTSGLAFGLICLGFKVSELQGNGPKYPTLPEVLFNKALIKLSIWLNDLAANSGKILFGGIDKAKYAGMLTTLKIEKGPDIPQLGVSVKSVSFRGAKATRPFTPLVDTGSESTYLPAEMTDIILAPLGAV
ncbi:hypothetical protein MMC22_010259 [Lobaria immixta]|nr:hypothetical protein [Lobaria immixta]